jgi:phosphate butyryltransferase
MITSFDGMLSAVKNCPVRKVAVAVAQDDAVLQAIQGAKAQGVADAILVGDRAKIEKVAAQLGIDVAGWEIIHEPDDHRAAYKAVELVSSGQANVLMKGLINTADLLRVVLDKEIGLRTGRVLSHVAVFEVPDFKRLIMITDGGMNVAPDLKQKADIIQNAVALAHALGNALPKIAVLAAVEVVNPDMPATLDAANLAKMADRGQIKGAIIDGPLALDNAINEEAARHKGIKSPVAGHADILVVPDIQTGNMLGKSLVYFAKGKIAGLIVGAAAPIVLTSRADTHEAKILSIALGSLMAK